MNFYSNGVNQNGNMSTDPNAIPPQGYPPYGYPPNPNAPYGYPMPNFNQIMQYREELRRQQREHIERQLQQNYPVKYVFFHGCICILLGIIAYIMQIILIVNRGRNYFIGSGFIGGTGLFALGILAFTTSNFQMYKIY